MNQESRIMDFGKKISGKIKEIQNKPEKEKIRIIWILAILIMALIAVIWFGFFGNYGISGGGNGGNQALGDLKNNLEKQFKDKFGGKLEIPKLEIPQNIPSERPKPSL